MKQNVHHSIYLLLVFLVMTVSWVVVCLNMPFDHEHIKDESLHLFFLSTAIENGGNFKDLAVTNLEDPPLFFIFSGVLSQLFHSQNRMTLAAPNLLFMLIALWMVYLLGLKYSGSLISLLAVAFSGLFLFSYSYTITPVMSLVMGVLMFIFGSVQLGNTEKFQYWILIYLGATAALLSKHSAPLFFIVPIIWMFWLKRQSGQLNRIFVIKVLAIFILASFSSWLIFYRHLDFGWLAQNLRWRTMDSFGEVAPGNILQHILFYPWYFAEYLLVPISLGVYALIKHKDECSSYAVWVLAIALLPMIVMSFFQMKHSEYLLPVAPIFILSVFSFIPPLWKNSRRKIAILIIIMLFSFLPLLGATIGHAKWEINIYKDQNRIFNQATEHLSELDKSGKIGVISSVRPMTKYMIINSLKRKGRKLSDISYLTIPPPDLPQTLIVFRNKLAGPNCYTNEELQSWIESNSPPKDQMFEIAQKAISEYIPIATYRSSAGSDLDSSAPVTICVHKQSGGISDFTNQ